MLLKKLRFDKTQGNILTVFIFALILTNLIFAGNLYNQAQFSKEYQIEIEEKANLIDELRNTQENDIKQKCTTYYTAQLQKLLSEQDLVFIAQKQWKYLFTLNGEVQDKHTIYIEEDSAHVILAEILNDNEILPENILRNGRITGNDPNDLLKEHCIVYTTIPYTVREDENDQGRRIMYDFKKIPHGTVISFKISPILAERLGTKYEEHLWESRIEIIRS